MFYTTLLFNKRGVLSKIWIAAHWEKKLTKANIFECNLDSAIQNIMSTKLHIALRTSGHLLLGVVRIYNRKVKYLLADCNEAFVKMKMSFCPGALDLTEDKQMASYKTITLPEVFHEFDSPLPDIACTDDHFMLNRSRPEDITLPENYGEGVEGLRCDSLFDVSTNSFQPENHSASAGQEESGLFTQDCFGDEGLIHTFFDDNPMNAVDIGLIKGIPELDSEILFPPCTSEQGHETDAEVDLEIPMSESEKIKPTDHYTTLAIEEDAFVLEPIDVTELQKRKKGKKRILKVDRVTQISSSAMRKQILDFSDTLTTVYMAPQTRQMMNWKKMGGVDWLLSNPCQTIIDGNLLMMFKHCLSIKFKKSTWEERSEPEFEIMRPEQVMDSTNMLQLEEPSHLHESHIADISTSDVDEMFQINNDAGQNEGPGSESIDPSGSLDPIPTFPDTEHHEDNAQSSDEQGKDKRTQDLLMVLRNLNRAGLTSFSFQKITKNNDRKEASVTFYSFLMLENQSAIELRQSEPYSDIIATPGPAFYSL